MTPDNPDYNDYSALDAPDHLFHVLEHFFQQKQNAFNYALAKKHFDSIKQQDQFVDASRLFKVLTGTNLITKKHVLHYRTAQGVRYLIKKEYAQSHQRNDRNARRTRLKNKDNDLTPTAKPSSPFVQLMASKTPIDDSSSDGSDPQPTIPDPTHTPEIPASVQIEDEVQSDITKHAEQLEKTMESAMADLQDPESPSQDEEHLNKKFEAIFSTTFLQKIDPLLRRLDQAEKQIKTSTEQYQVLLTENKTLQTKLDDLKANYDRLNRQVNFNSRGLETFDNRLQPLENFRNNISDNIKLQVDELVKPHIDRLNEQIRHDLADDQGSVKTIVDTQEKVKRRITRLKEGTKKMFKDVEDDYDIIADRIHRLESKVQDLDAKNKSTPTSRKLDYNTQPPASDDDSSFSSLPHKPSSKHYSSPISSSHKPYHNSYYRGPNIDYLRKNVNITCSEPNQILEFYIKFRLVLEQGGIHILPIDKISKNNSIAQDKPNITDDDQRLQSNALYTLLSNEKIIPPDFTMAQNCIQGFASTMDGFGALRAMLKLTHPTLSKKRPSNVPPVLSESSDIHSYEQSLRNFYLLHKLFSNIEFPPLEKAKQFLHGMDDGQYGEAVQRVQHQLDTFESLKVPLTEDYNIDNIASTIINISSEYDNTKTVVNTMRRDFHRTSSHQNQNSSSTYNKQPRKDFNSRSTQAYRKDKYDKAQCFACKQFGHTVTHCRLLPKVLAIMQFHRKHDDKCDMILRQHIRNNTVDSKRVFVRTLQNMNILSQTDDSDSYLETDMIVNTMTDNGVDHHDFNSDEE